MDDLREPEELATEAVAELEGAVAELNALIELLDNGNSENAIAITAKSAKKR